MADMTKYDSKLVAVGRIALAVKYDDTAATVRLPALQVLAEVVERLSSWLNRTGKAEEAMNSAFDSLEEFDRGLLVGEFEHRIAQSNVLVSRTPNSLRLLFRNVSANGLPNVPDVTTYFSSNTLSP